MSIPIKKELSYPAFAVWGTKRGKKIFFFDQFEQQETVNSIDGMLTDLRDAVSNPSTTTPFYSLEKKGNVCIFSIYTSINDWLGRSGYYAVSLLMHSNQELKSSSILEALTYFSDIYFEQAIKDSGQKRRISEYTDEEVNKALFQKEFMKKEEFHLVPTQDSKLYKGTEKACFNYSNETEIDTFFKNRNHTDIAKYQTIYFLPKEEETQTALTCINEIPAFKPVEKVEEITPPKEETKSKIELPPKDDTKEDKDLKKQDDKDDLPKVNTKGEKKNNEQDSQPKEDQTKETKQNPQETDNKKETFLKSKKGKIILAVLIIFLLVATGGAILHFASDNTEIKEDETQKFTQAQADKFIAEIDSIAKPILAEGWKWSDTEYKQAKKLIIEKDSALAKIIVSDEISKTELNRAENYSKKIKLKLEAAYNLAIKKKADELIGSTEFDYLIAKELYQEIDSFNVKYADTVKLKNFTSVSFAVYQAKQLIKKGELPTGKKAIVNDKKEPITDFKEAALKLNSTINFILNDNKKYDFITTDQKCHLKEYSNILIALKHKAGTEKIMEWVIKNKKDTKRVRELRAFLNNGICTNQNK